MINESRPDPTQALRDAITGVMMGKNFPLPGEIVSFDGSTMSATIKPCIKQKKTSGELEERAEIPNVPVHFWSAGGFAIHAAPQKGDEVFLIFSGRSMDVFKSNGGCVDPGDGRFLHTSDCIALVGSFSDPKAKDGKAPGDDLWIGLRDGSVGLTITPGGKVSLGSDTAELVQLVEDVIKQVGSLMSALKSAQVAVTAINTPAPFAPPALAAIEAVESALDAVALKLGSIKI